MGGRAVVTFFGEIYTHCLCREKETTNNTFFAVEKKNDIILVSSQALQIVNISIPFDPGAMQQSVFKQHTP